ncbi:MAG: hypothetical protein U5K30_17595 [Acidimicrobiales bacterium]|nr:hypothetical protein [Acidimicrobiales bacterium]
MALTTVTTVLTALPWGSSGDRARSSYQIIEVVERAGVMPSSTAGLAPVWLFVPALCGAAVLAAAFHAPRLAAGLAGTLGSMVVVGGVLVARSPLITEPAATASVLAGTGTTATAVATLATTWRRKRE